MKDSVQNKINHIKDIANKTGKTILLKTNNSYRSNDSLSKAIRNQGEANLFLAELDAVIKVARQK